jgi:hypothetical protein
VAPDYARAPSGLRILDLNVKQRNRHCEPPDRANARPMTGSAKQSSFFEPQREKESWIASSLRSSQ